MIRERRTYIIACRQVGVLDTDAAGSHITRNDKHNGEKRAPRIVQEGNSNVAWCGVDLRTEASYRERSLFMFRS